MGLMNSKSPLERRNTVERRSQRRSIHGIKSKVEALDKAIRRFKGIEEDEKYKELSVQIERVKHELSRKATHLQPQVQTIYNVVLNNINEAQKNLDAKLKENQEKPQKKKKEEKPEEPEDKEDKEKESNDVVVEEVTEDEAAKEENSLADSDDKRKTVELKFVQFVGENNNETMADVHEVEVRTPEQTRASILKVGVPVMPGAIMSEVSQKMNRISRQYQEQYSVSSNPDNQMKQINDTIEKLQMLEYEIHEFVGRKNGKHYNAIRNRLNMYLIELNQVETNDDEIVDQLKMCKNYVGTCFNFLDEKATVTGDSSDDEVFDHNDTKQPEERSSVDSNTRLQKLMKTTAI